MLKTLRNYALYFAWLIAVVSLLVTLYSSEVLHMPVCHLCWYQRIALYPLSIILGIAAYYNDTKICKYALPLAIISMLFALYQYLMQMIPGFAPIELCGVGPSCAETHFKLLGFMTYPLLSFMAALFIAILLLTSRYMRINQKSRHTHYVSRL